MLVRVWGAQPTVNVTRHSWPCADLGYSPSLLPGLHQHVIFMLPGWLVGCCMQVQALSATMKHHIPMEVLFREHWAGVLLQFLLEAAYGTAFYTFFTYMPSYMSKELHVPASNTLWSLLIGLVLFAVTVPLAGHFVGDTKVRVPCHGSG